MQSYVSLSLKQAAEVRTHLLDRMLPPQANVVFPSDLTLPTIDIQGHVPLADAVPPKTLGL